MPADRDSIVDISKKLDNKAFQNTVKNRFKTLLGKGGKFGTLIGAGTLAGTGFALADQPGVQEATSVLPTAAAAGTGAAAVGTKTGRNILGKIFRGAGTPLAGLGFAGTNVYSKMKEGKSLGEAVMDPLTGLELTFPSLFTENISKITKNPAIQRVLNLGGLQRVLGPAGAGIATVSSLRDRAKAMAERGEGISNLEDIIKQQEEIEDFAAKDYRGYAGGGIMKMAGKSSGPPPESGPTSQGLDFLIKRGRQY